jgi:hypothetical protein
MIHSRLFQAKIFGAILAVGAAVAFALHRLSADIAAISILGLSAFLACIVASAIQVAGQWNKAVSVRLGRPGERMRSGAEE